MRSILALAALVAGPATAEGRAGDFDYYVLSLSWSPTWCAEQGTSQGSPQCAPERDLGWMLHGLWPQYEEGGWPDYCEAEAPRDGAFAEMADIMGTAGLAAHEWNRHGSCSGLDAEGYFDLSRRAFEMLSLPEFGAEERAVSLPAAEVEAAFLEVNQGLEGEGVIVTCAAGRIDEIRICLDRELGFRTCGDDLRRDCRSRAILPPPP